MPARPEPAPTAPEGLAFLGLRGDEPDLPGVAFNVEFTRLANNHVGGRGGVDIVARCLLATDLHLGSGVVTSSDLPDSDDDQSQRYDDCGNSDDPPQPVRVGIV